MYSPESPSHQLIALSREGELQQLSSALQQPTTAQIALGTESFLIDARTQVHMRALVLERMIEAAARPGHTDVVEMLILFGQQHDIAASHMVTMDTLDAAWDENCLEILLKFQVVDPDVFYRPRHLGADLLSSVCWGGPDEEEFPRIKYLGLLQHLMSIGFDPNKSGVDPTSRRYRPGSNLRVACRIAGCEIIECLLQHGAVIKESIAMRTASCHGRIDVLEALLKYGGDVNEVSGREDSDGPSGTPLHVAAAAEREDAVRWLLAHGADVTIKNCDGISPQEILEEKEVVI
jgi:ankyrin repeat protein